MQTTRLFNFYKPVTPGIQRLRRRGYDVRNLRIKRYWHGPNTIVVYKHKADKATTGYRIFIHIYRGFTEHMQFKVGQHVVATEYRHSGKQHFEIRPLSFIDKQKGRKLSRVKTGRCMRLSMNYDPAMDGLEFPLYFNEKTVDVGVQGMLLHIASKL